MELYKFETDQFGLSDKGIHLLRSRFNYKTIDLSSVDNITVAKGRQVNNWLVLLIFGLALSFFGLFTAAKVIYEFFFANNYDHFYIEQFVIPVLPLSVGVFSVLFSLKIGPVLLVTFKNKTKRFPIGQLQKKSQVDELISFLRKNDLTKNKFSSELEAHKTNRQLATDRNYS